MPTPRHTTLSFLLAACGLLAIGCGRGSQTGSDAAEDTAEDDQSGPSPEDGDPPDNPDPSSPGSDDPNVSVARCNQLQLPNTVSGCMVLDGGAETLFVGTVLTDDTVYEPGTVLVDAGGQISCTGCDCEAQAPQATRVLCSESVISPGLINTHDHMGWMADWPHVPEDPALRYEHRHDWRTGDPPDGEPEIEVEGNASFAEKEWGELRFVLSGATSINGSGSAWGLLRNLDRGDSLEGLQVEPVTYDTFPLDDASGEMRTDDCSYPDLVQGNWVAEQRVYTPHVAEGINVAARNEFLCLTRDDRGGNAALGANTAIMHGVGMHAADIALAAERGMTLIWSPRSNISLYGDTAPVTLFDALQIPIALGTDWLPTGSMNMLRELACAANFNRDHLGGYFTHADLWRMATVDAARALGLENQIGRLRAGNSADLAIFRRGDDQGPYEAVVRAHPQDVRLVVRGGDVLSGDAELVAALADGCDALDVCSAAKRVCLQSEIDTSLSALRAEVGADMYPLFFCGTPQDEPACLPTRPSSESIAGSSIYTDGATQSDGDGDGVDDAVDNCLDIFNPVRPLDMGAQADFDADGIGDACDPCPLTEGTSDCGE